MSDGKAAIGRLMYNERYPNYPWKSRLAFCCLKNRFLQYGCVRSKICKRATIVNEEKSADVVAYVTVNLHASSKLIATESGSQILVIGILYNYTFHLTTCFFIKTCTGTTLQIALTFVMCRQVDLNPLFTYYLMKQCL